MLSAQTYRVTRNKRTGGLLMALPREMFDPMHAAGIVFRFEIRPDEGIIIMHPQVDNDPVALDTEAADSLVRRLTGKE